MPPDPDSADLQFDRAESLPGAVTEPRAAPPAGELSAADLARAAVFGTGAALAGAAIYFGVVAITGYEIGWIALLVGWMVGKAVARGGRGLGGWPLQTLAVGLTYLSIVGAYWPVRFTLLPPLLQGVGGILGFIILLIGLYEAWKLNRRV